MTISFVWGPGAPTVVAVAVSGRHSILVICGGRELTDTEQDSEPDGEEEWRRRAAPETRDVTATPAQMRASGRHAPRSRSQACRSAASTLVEGWQVNRVTEIR
jgi:hypothetical protein